MPLEIWKVVAEAFKALITSWPLALCVLAFIFRESLARFAGEVASAIPHALREGRSVNVGLTKEGLSMKIAERQQEEAQKIESQKPIQGLSEASVAKTEAKSLDATIPPDIRFLACIGRGVFCAHAQ